MVEVQPNQFLLTVSHAAWKHGLGIQSHGSGLSPVWVPKEDGKTMEAEARRDFAYNDIPEPKANGVSKQDLACRQKFYGLCKLDVGLTAGQSFAHNWHILVRKEKHKIEKSDLPVLISLSLIDGADVLAGSIITFS